ncbi:LuxR C-terminal-related transcriptional regulator [Thermogemmatispora sp.]|uniref:LuxR C-terminal-related transcriptional regulator n=1 Tax=Thermogemmatispora sp. TaxID=1968838 RepID=UPI001D838763|nr:response regulator transcription factor [Thermogemmatispora sp.]MBX5451527.1 response regulator transcription factor [Thermogemmatispora sp.]
MPSQERQLLPFYSTTQRVIIAHEADIFCRGLHSLLETCEEFEVLAEVNSCTALLDAATKTTVDTVLIDCALSDGDCIELTRRLNESPSPPHVVLLASGINNELLLQALLNGASGYLTKDTPGHQVLACLQGLRRGELALVPYVAGVAIRLLVWECYRLAATLSAHTSTIRPSQPPTVEAQIDPSQLQPETLYGESHRPTAWPHLTAQEQKILRLLRLGLSNKQIAARLSISPYTVGKHVQHILRKLGASNRTQAASHTPFEGPQARDEQ